MATAVLLKEKWASADECRAYYEAHHPHVKKAIDEGGCILVTSPFGVLAIGDLSKPCLMSQMFRYKYATRGANSEERWPRLWFGDIEVEFIEQLPKPNFANYRIIPNA